MRFTRHAKNNVRWLGVRTSEIEEVIANPIEIGQDETGKPQYIGEIRGVRVRVVVALDEPDLVVTIHKRKR